MVNQVPTYCAMCTSRCGVVATVEDGKLTRVAADPAHPNGCVCVKGTAAPDIVYANERLRYPLIRTRPKGDPDPGWHQITWDQALDLIVSRLKDIKTKQGAEAVVFSRATTAGSAAIDFDPWLQRFVNAFGSPNLLTSNHICTWNRRVGSKFTYGVGMPTPDFDQTRCMLLWGINPQATSPAQAQRIARARSHGAKLIVVDPRRTSLAEKADCWLRVLPGTDGILAMAMIHVLIEENLYDAAFVRNWTNGTFLLREDNQRYLTDRDLSESGNPQTYFAWDERSNALVGYDPERGFMSNAAALALSGKIGIRLSDGIEATCRPVFDILQSRAAPWAPEKTQASTGVPPGEVRRAARLFATEKPSCYCTWVGLEQDAQAMQTNRAVCIFYALTGQFDHPGSNVIFDTPHMNTVTGRELLPDDKAALRLGLIKHPLGPPSDPGLVQPAEVYEAILSERPYPIKAMILFGGDPLLGHGDPLTGKAALERLEFYVHVDIIANPSAQFADLLLPASTCWEREALMPSFDIAKNTIDWVQLRPAVIEPLYESRSDSEVIFELAKRLDLGDLFFSGDIDAGLAFQLAPSGLSVRQLREHPRGMRVQTQTRYRKYCETDSVTGQPMGFQTPTRKIELYSTTFAAAGYAALPEIKTDCSHDEHFTLTLTFFRDIHFCDEQHRNIPRLRRRFPEPCLEINPRTAESAGIENGQWLFLETARARVKLKAKFNSALHPKTVATVYGWWQSCEPLKLSGYHPLCADGANANLLISNANIDPISASVAHRSQRCRVTRL